MTNLDRGASFTNPIIAALWNAISVYELRADDITANGLDKARPHTVCDLLTSSGADWVKVSDGYTQTFEGALARQVWAALASCRALIDAAR